ASDSLADLDLLYLLEHVPSKALPVCPASAEEISQFIGYAMKCVGPNRVGLTSNIGRGILKILDGRPRTQRGVLPRLFLTPEPVNLHTDAVVVILGQVVKLLLVAVTLKRTRAVLLAALQIRLLAVVVLVNADQRLLLVDLALAHADGLH